jgi:hypothetical protein
MSDLQSYGVRYRPKEIALMYPLKFVGLDMDALTFTGLSNTLARRVAAWSSFGILIALVTFLYFVSLIPNRPLEITVVCFSFFVLVLYIATGRFMIKDLATLFEEHTPLSVLYRSDKKIISEARDGLMKVADSVDFRHYYEYRKINPAIGSRRHLLVIAHQRKGDLLPWSAHSRNLKALSDLVFQIHLAECVIEQDRRRNEAGAGQ